MQNRATVVYLRKTEKLTYGQIAAKTGVSKTSVQDWVKAYEESGQLVNHSPGPKKGSYTKITLALIDLVKKFMKGKERRGTRPCVLDLKTKHNIKVSRRTVRRILKNHLKLHPYKKKKRPLLKDHHKEHRLDVAEGFLEYFEESGENPWEDMVFSDECRFNSEPKPNSKNDVIWDDAPDDEKHYQERSKYAGQSIEVWGCITRYGKPNLIEIKRPMITVNGERQKRRFKSQDYIDKILVPVMPKLRTIFEEQGIDEEDWIFQQDGDAKHTSNLVQNWLENNVQSYTNKNEWPANSPDLSIIENCWSVIWVELAKHKIQTRGRLVQLVKKYWKEKITPDYIEKLYNSLPNRMAEVVRLKGGITKY